MRCTRWLALLTALGCANDAGKASTTGASTTLAASSSATTGSGGAGGSGGLGGAGGTGGAAIAVNCAPPEGAIPDLAVDLLVDGLDSPVAVEFAPGETDRFFIVEKSGRIRIVQNGVLLAEPFLDLSGIVWNEGEAGLLSLAFHPDYQTTGRFFVYFVEYVNDGAQLAEFRVSASDPNKADPVMVGGAPLLRMFHSSIHLGGALEFSPADGLLYLTTGERGYGPWAQDLQRLLGKVLRIDVSTTPYTIPSGNLAGGLPEIWDYGLRNPWRAAFDPCTGDLFIADVGENQREEVNIERAGIGNQNYGWPMMEGTECHPVSSPCDTKGLTLPAIDYGHNPHPDGFFAIIGGGVYRGSALPSLRGKYVHTDTSARFFVVEQADGMASSSTMISLTFEGASFSATIVSIGQDNEGELYLVELDPGRIYKLVPGDTR